MVAEHLDDGEGEMLRRVREVVGPDLPVAVSLDLHANVTPEMVAFADSLEIYRTYPHVDMAATGRRRSEERRIGKECVSTCRSRWSPDHSKKKSRENRK